VYQHARPVVIAQSRPVFGSPLTLPETAIRLEYNPGYNLQSMPSRPKTDKLGLEGCGGHMGGKLFEIRIKGHLSDQWSDWLEGLEMKRCDNGEMILTGTIVDQSALLGILNKLNRLNLTLLSVTEIEQPNQP
jgi:hypothetical protein